MEVVERSCRRAGNQCIIHIIVIGAGAVVRAVQLQ